LVGRTDKDRRNGTQHREKPRPLDSLIPSPLPTAPFLKPAVLYVPKLEGKRWETLWGGRTKHEGRGISTCGGEALRATLKKRKVASVLEYGMPPSKLV